MELSNLSKSISELNLDSSIIHVLQANNIIKVKDLWLLKRADLKKYKLSDFQIHQIIIKMQLYGLDLNKKIYKKY